MTSIGENERGNKCTRYVTPLQLTSQAVLSGIDRLSSLFTSIGPSQGNPSRRTIVGMTESGASESWPDAARAGVCAKIEKNRRVDNFCDRSAIHQFLWSLNSPKIVSGLNLKVLCSSGKSDNPITLITALFFAQHISCGVALLDKTGTSSRHLIGWWRISWNGLCNVCASWRQTKTNFKYSFSRCGKDSR